jgi:hypothetical protein
MLGDHLFTDRRIADRAAGIEARRGICDEEHCESSEQRHNPDESTHGAARRP